MAGTKAKIVRNTIANTIMRLWAFILSFILFPYIVSHIGTVNYGIWALAGSIAGYFALLDFGMVDSVVKYVAEYNAKRDYDALNGVFNSAFFFYVSIGIVVSTLLFLSLIHI